MKKLIILIGVFIAFFLCTSNVSAKDVDVYIFYSESCPHCHAEIEYLNTRDDIVLHSYEVSSFDNSLNFNKVITYFGASSEAVPYTVIGSKGTLGYAEYMQSDFDDQIEYCKTNDCIDVMEEIGLGNLVAPDDVIEDNSTTDTIVNPITGNNIDAKSVSIPFLAVIMGLIDGFNPCAMWILIFLISLLITTKDKKKMWVLGLTFILTSGIMYALIMFFGFKIADAMNKANILKLVIGFFGLLAGFYNLYKYIKERKKDVGCTVTSNKKRIRIINFIKDYVNKNSLFLGVLGMILLACSVNIIELMCSAGLPAMFSSVLVVNDTSTIASIGYILLYILFFLIDDFIIFFIAVKTYEIKGMSNKYTKYSHLSGGIVMVLIGIYLLSQTGLFDPNSTNIFFDFLKNKITSIFN